MDKDEISKIWIDKNNRLCIKPRTTTFEMIYRSAMGVYWNSTDHYLYPQSIGEWSPIDWYRQIISAVENEYNCRLYITQKTNWENISESLKLSIIM